MDELLQRAQHIVERQHNSNAANHAELLTSIGRKYLGQDEDGRARPLIEQAYQVSRKLKDPSPRAQASCALASAYAHSDLPRADALIQEGLRELPGDPQFTLDRISCLLSASLVAREGGDSQQAIARGKEAGRLLASSPLRSERRIAKGDARRVLSRPVKVATPLRPECVGLMTAPGATMRKRPVHCSTIALALHGSGRTLEAEKPFRRLSISRADPSEQGVSAHVAQ